VLEAFVTGRRDVEIFETAEAAGARGAELFLDAARDALAARGRFSVALSGGSSPVPLFRCLAKEAPRAGIDWSAVHVFWADERCVPPDHPQSNFRLADELLLSKLPVPGAVIHRIPGEETPDEAARCYEAELSASFPDEEIPVFDLLLLGVGSDGHTASLFPGMDLESFSPRKAVAVYVEKLQSSRVTLTLPVLCNAHRIVFFVMGAAKAGIFGEIFGGSGEAHYPAARVAASENHVSWLLDREAAGGIVQP
jgi:6-phosphogluconolactonase